MNAFTRLNARAVLLPVNNIDTDQIIPARFLKVTDKNGLGAMLFSDWRYLPDGSPNPDFVLNQPESQGAQVLIAGNNFGCGSSREHAPWALMGFGFRAVISTEFADIFRNNALKNGLLPILATEEQYQMTLGAMRAAPDRPISVDLAEQRVILPNKESFTFPIDDFSKTCLLQGVDQLGYILNLDAQITAYEQAAVL